MGSIYAFRSIDLDWELPLVLGACGMAVAYVVSQR